MPNRICLDNGGSPQGKTSIQPVHKVFDINWANQPRSSAESSIGHQPGSIHLMTGVMCPMRTEDAILVFPCSGATCPS